MEFKRSNDLPELPQILSGNDLIKKLEEKNKNREKNDDGKEECKCWCFDFVKHTVSAVFLVIDYQQNRKPDAKENDYKEMGLFFFGYNGIFMKKTLNWVKEFWRREVLYAMMLNCPPD